MTPTPTNHTIPCEREYPALACRSESTDWDAILPRLQVADPTARLIHAALKKKVALL